MKQNGPRCSILVQKLVENSVFIITIQCAIKEICFNPLRFFFDLLLSVAGCLIVKQKRYRVPILDTVIGVYNLEQDN